MKIPSLDPERAFTVFEALVVVVVVFILIAVLLPALQRPKIHGGGMNCINNLKQDGIAFRIWEGDNNDKYPMAVSVTNGGAMERLAADDVVTCFQVMSNELATPKLLYCPDDIRHVCATDFGGALSRTNLSYFVSLDAVESDPGAVMMGDANLVWQGRPAAGILDLRKGAATWTKDRHQGAGCVLLADGSVQSATRIGLTNSPANTLFSTNQLVLP